jgi:hypothetical protein
MVGHVWVEVGHDLADFSAGDWRPEFERSHANIPADGLGPVNWLAEPPEFVWQSAAPLKAAWRRRGEPTIGQVWYGPWCSPKLPEFASHDSVVADAMPWIVARIETLHLRERIAAINVEDVACGAALLAE